MYFYISSCPCTLYHGCTLKMSFETIRKWKRHVFGFLDSNLVVSKIDCDTASVLSFTFNFILSFASWLCRQPHLSMQKLISPSRCACAHSSMDVLFSPSGTACTPSWTRWVQCVDDYCRRPPALWSTHHHALLAIAYILIYRVAEFDSCCKNIQQEAFLNKELLCMIFI